mgnify:CR=1 FL=1
MKKILTFLLCIIIVCAIPLVAFAEEGISTSADTNTTVTENLTTETENVTESEISATEEAPTVTPVLTTEEFLNWIFENYEEIAVILAVISAALLIVERLTKVIKAIITCNNNAVDIAEESKATTQAALEEVNSVKEIVNTYKEEVANLLAEVRQSDEEKKKIEAALAKADNHLQMSKLANTELANEVAELLVLANIPNSKKEELYSRHRAAVDALDAAEHKDTEVKEDVREEA